jgi:NhaA family Na+:H+ antiporter
VDRPHSSTPDRALPPEAWGPARRAADALIAPVQRFLAVEAASGLVLVAATAAALVWANSAWSDSYHQLWHLPIGVQAGAFTFVQPLHFWINDGLMTIFFFVVGLEIRREIHEGQLSEWRRAALPLAAALGGMLIPAAIYAALNTGRAGSAGWGIPMATDIAFAVGVLTLLGSRCPPALRVLLLALAVIDDIGAIAVIAVFYSGGVSIAGLLLGAAGLAGVVVLRGLGVRAPLPYLVPGAVVWCGLLVAGVHPTLAGVLIGLATPARVWLDGSEEVSPAERLQHALHSWVAFGIMPLFALANAGVELGGADLGGDGLFLFLGILFGLAIGKPIGITAFAAASTAAGLATRPDGVATRGLLLVGMTGGIGFTMSLFIAQLAFPPGPLLDTAKLAILVASGTAIAAGLVYGACLGRRGGVG